MLLDFEIKPGVWFGEWFHEEIASRVYMEKRGFFPERVARVSERLQKDRPVDLRFKVEIPWSFAFTAFTAPGQYIYFSRRMLERCPDEDTTAFVIAHEIAHHDLGHLEIFQGPFARHAKRLAGGMLVIIFFRLLQKRIYSPQWEREADLRAIEMCVRAGYDGYKCLRIFHVMELYALDYHDLDMVYGPDPENAELPLAESDLRRRARVWLWQKKRGYLPIRKRRAVVRRHLEEILKEGVPDPQGT